MPDPALALAIALAGMALAGAVLYPDRGLIARWRKSRPRPAEIVRQDALKVILQREIDLLPISRNEIAARLNLDSIRVASVLEGLAQRGHIVDTDEQIRLTAEGREQAAQIVRAHRLWERHLAEETGFAEAEWHEQAEREEHRMTPTEAEALARSLGHPARDPHGDPIPTADGELVAPPGIPLRSAPPGSTARIAHVEDEPPETFARLTGLGLVPGTVVQRLSSGPEVVIFRANGDEIRLSPSVADNLSVVILPGEPAAAAPAGRPLSSLRPGMRGVVLEISPRCRGAERRRMLDLGILPGTEIEAVMTSPAGDPTAYRIRDALIALRRTQAGLIRIESDPA